MNLEQRIDALEKTHGLGSMGAIAEGIIHGASIKEDRLTALGETWERRRGESNGALRKRAVEELRRNDKRVLTRKVFKEYAKAMRESTYGHIEAN